jgi:putative transposase
MQLVAGRTAQEYNKRKERKGAFWEDRYHATLIDTGSYLDQCMVYIDMNMLRAGVVKHPEAWLYCGFHELITRKSRYAILDVQSLMDLFSIQNSEDLIKLRRFAVEEAIRKEQHLIRDEKWTESVAVGSRSFLEKTKKENLVKCRGRVIDRKENLFILGEEKASYNAHFAPKKAL